MQYEIFKIQVIKYLREQRSHRSEKLGLTYQRSERSSERSRGRLIADRLDSEILRGDIWMEQRDRQ